VQREVQPAGHERDAHPGAHQVQQHHPLVHLADDLPLQPGCRKSTVISLRIAHAGGASTNLVSGLGPFVTFAASAVAQLAISYLGMRPPMIAFAGVLSVGALAAVIRSVRTR
jgi:hypothetical protein